MKLSTQRSGSGTPLLLIHGMGSASTAWKLVTPELAKKFTVITIDLPGHGNSDFDPQQAMDPSALAELVLQNMQDLGIEKFHVAGNSLGGWISLELAANYPEIILSVTGVAPAGLWLTPWSMRVPGSAISRYLATGLRTVAPSLLKFPWGRKIGFAGVSPLWEEFDYELCVDATLALSRAQGYFPAWDGLLRKRFDKAISAAIPVTIIFGDTDNTLPARTSQERVLTPPHARWTILPQSGHAPMWDHPEEVIAEIFATTGISV
ncbi:MAG: alpha/beta fold hydrolase [Actinomycetes bacterium]